MTNKFLITTVLFFSVLYINAQEFKVISFNIDDKDLSARVTSSKDKNSQNCALIKVQTNLTGLNFNCGQGFCTDMIYDGAGEYCLYVSPGSQFSKFRKKFFAAK